jgi:hypothetical protein
MRFVKGIHSVDYVEKTLARCMEIIQLELVTMQRSQEGNSISKQFACPLEELHDACVDFLEREKLKSPDSTMTVPYFAA